MADRERWFSPRQQTLIRMGLLFLTLLILLSGGVGVMRLRDRVGEQPLRVTSTSLAPLSWEPDDAETGRVMEAATRQQVQQDYLRAWLQWNLAYRNQETGGLATIFTGPALDAVTASVESAIAAQQQVMQANTGHEVQLHLYAADGSIVAFTDSRAAVSQLVLDEGGKLLLMTESVATYDVVMMLEDGNWRVHNWVRTSAEPVASPVPLVPSTTFARTEGDNLQVNGEFFAMAGVNYYPRDTPWDLFWSNYDPAVIDADFQLIAETLKLNTIRIFVPWEGFGGANPRAEMLLRLDDLLRRARDRNLQVIVTLFDFYGGQYDPVHWADANRYLTGIVGRFKDHPAILAWDLKNEPDLDPNPDVVVDAWLRHVAGVVRQLDPNHLITIGWAGADQATRAIDAVDVVSFHFYRPADQLDTAMAQLTREVDGRPLLLTEFGLPTWSSPFFPNGHSEKEQAAYYADLLTAFNARSGAGYLAWTLHDFSIVPATVGGRFPWEREPEAALGIVRGDGTLKPAAALLQINADLERVPRLTAIDRAIKPFRLFVALVLTGGSGVVIMLRRWRKTKRT